MRLIDGNKLKEKAVPLLFPTEMELCGYLPGTVQAVTVSEIEDMMYRESVEVVRCKDCWGYEGGFCFARYVGCGCVTPPRKPDDYCSYGERKDGEG